MLDSNKDNALVKRAQAGETAVIGELYDRHQDRIYRYIWSRVGNQQLAEDLTGDVFERMVANLPSYQIGKTPFHAWLYQIARNLIVDTYRKEEHRQTEPLETAAAQPDGSVMVQTAVEQKWAVEQVHHALEVIDPIQREVIILRFMVGMSIQEVALTLEKTVGAVKTLQHRGLKALRVALM